MKIINLPASVKDKVILVKDEIKQLCGKVGVITTAQYLNQLDSIVKQVPGGVRGGQVLGCNASGAHGIDVDCYLFVGTGTFHPVRIAIETGKKVHCYNPVTHKFTELDEELIKKHDKRVKGGILKFLSSNIIGVLISTKPGQCKQQKAEKLVQRKDKQYYLFSADTINLQDLEQFPFIECWINTACVRIADEKSMVNLEDLEKYYREELLEELI